MAFILSTFLISILMLLSMLAQAFRAMDAIIVIQSTGLIVTLLDLMCLSYLFYVVYDFLGWLSSHREISMKEVGGLDK